MKPSKREALIAEAPNVSTIQLTQLGDKWRVKGRKILKDAAKEHLDEVMVVGRTEDGDLWTSSSLNAGQSLWLLEKLRERIMSGNPWSIV